MNCPECARAELIALYPVAGRLALAVLDRLYPPSPLSGLGAAWSAALGSAVGRAPLTHYERHREEWVRTGDQREYDRMLALVT